MKITVIGATGMIGSRIVAEAVQRGHEVTAASRSGAMAKGVTRSDDRARPAHRRLPRRLRAILWPFTAT